MHESETRQAPAENRRSASPPHGQFDADDMALRAAVSRRWGRRPIGRLRRAHTSAGHAPSNATTRAKAASPPWNFQGKQPRIKRRFWNSGGEGALIPAPRLLLRATEVSRGELEYRRLDGPCRGTPLREDLVEPLHGLRGEELFARL